MPPYIIDTSIWIRIKFNHPPHIFKKFWQQLDGSITARAIHSPEEVLKELEKGSEDMAAQLKAKAADLFVPLDGPFQDAVAQVMARCGDLADEENERSLADPFVVALAMLRNGTVVTGEKARKAPTARRKIPDACGELNVPCYNWFQFLEEVGWEL